MPKNPLNLIQLELKLSRIRIEQLKQEIAKLEETLDKYHTSSLDFQDLLQEKEFQIQHLQFQRQQEQSTRIATAKDRDNILNDLNDLHVKQVNAEHLARKLLQLKQENNSLTKQNDRLDRENKRLWTEWLNHSREMRKSPAADKDVNTYTKTASLYEELRALADNLQTPIWSTLQIHKNIPNLKEPAVEQPIPKSTYFKPFND